MDCVDLAELAGGGEMGGEFEIADGSSLGAGLEDSAVAVDCVCEVLAVADRYAARFFAVDVFACFCGDDGGECVPVVAGCYEDGVDVVSGEDFVHVAVHDAIFVAVFLVGEVFYDLASALLYVGDCDELYVRFVEHALEYVASARAYADCAEDDFLTWGDGAVFAEDCRGDYCWGGDCEG